MQARLLDELGAHHNIFIEKRAGIIAVGADTADHGREMDDHVGLVGSVEVGNGVGLG